MVYDHRFLLEEMISVLRCAVRVKFRVFLVDIRASLPVSEWPHRG
jgi:hypothetical protein